MREDSQVRLKAKQDQNCIYTLGFLFQNIYCIGQILGVSKLGFLLNSGQKSFFEAPFPSCIFSKNPIWFFVPLRVKEFVRGLDAAVLLSV